MNKKWKAETLENILMNISVKEKDMILEEVAEIVYTYISQLPENSIARSSFDEGINILQRTGTHA